MITAIFSRCLNLIWSYVPTAKSGVHIAHSPSWCVLLFYCETIFYDDQYSVPPPPPPSKGD